MLPIHRLVCQHRGAVSWYGAFDKMASSIAHALGQSDAVQNPPNAWRIVTTFERIRPVGLFLAQPPAVWLDRAAPSARNALRRADALHHETAIAYEDEFLFLAHKAIIERKCL
jgi:hypothetical protein